MDTKLKPFAATWDSPTRSKQRIHASKTRNIYRRASTKKTDETSLEIIAYVRGTPFELKLKHSCSRHASTLKPTVLEGIEVTPGTSSRTKSDRVCTALTHARLLRCASDARGMRVPEHVALLHLHGTLLNHVHYLHGVPQVREDVRCAAHARSTCEERRKAHTS